MIPITKVRLPHSNLTIEIVAPLRATGRLSIGLMLFALPDIGFTTGDGRG
jgi:hypothetical protein